MVDTKSLVKLIEILETLAPEDRVRNINAALTVLGDPILATPRKSAAEQPLADSPGVGDHHPTGVSNLARQYGVPTDHVDRVFNFHADGTFAIIAVPGKSKREMTLNTYVLVGLGTFIASGQRDFTDAVAREACRAHACYDQGNHASTLKGKHPAFVAKGDDWSLTIPGIKDGIALMKEVVDEASKS